MFYNLVSLSVNLSRAYEIAETGFHKLHIKSSTASKVDLDLLREFYGITEDGYPAILVDVEFSTQEIMNSITAGERCETKEAILKRVKDAREKPAVKPCLPSGACTSLLKTAVERLQLPFSETVKIIEVAATIARLEGDKEIKVQHVAEAIQYCPTTHKDQE